MTSLWFVSVKGWRMSLAQASVPYQGFQRPPAFTGLALAATGLAIWTSLAAWGGASGHGAGFHLREAWNTSAYFYLGLPLMALAVALAAYLAPQRPWRWPLWLVGGHQAGLLLVGLGMQTGLSLLILTLALAILLAVILSLPAFIGSRIARSLRGDRFARI